MFSWLIAEACMLFELCQARDPWRASVRPTKWLTPDSWTKWQQPCFWDFKRPSTSLCCCLLLPLTDTHLCDNLLHKNPFSTVKSTACPEHSLSVVEAVGAILKPEKSWPSGGLNVFESLWWWAATSKYSPCHPKLICCLSSLVSSHTLVPHFDETKQASVVVSMFIYGYS